MAPERTEMVKQTAGRDALGDFAPKFAQLNDDVLFGEVWSREDKLSLKMRSVVTISALIGKGITDSSLKYHLVTAPKSRFVRRRGLRQGSVGDDVLQKAVSSIGDR